MPCRDALSAAAGQGGRWADAAAARGARRCTHTVTDTACACALAPSSGGAYGLLALWALMCGLQRDWAGATCSLERTAHDPLWTPAGRAVRVLSEHGLETAAVHANLAARHEGC